MKKTNVKVCDLCENKLSKDVCHMCKKDVCPYCRRIIVSDVDEDDLANGNINMRFAKSKPIKGDVILCKNCVNNFVKMFDCYEIEKTEKISEEDAWDLAEDRGERFRKSFIDFIRDWMVTEKL